MADKKSKIDEDELELFRQSMKDVKPISQNKIDPDLAPKPTKRKAEVGKPEKYSIFAEQDYVIPVSPDETLHFARNGVQPKIMTKLKKGQMPVNSRIDLHGLTVNRAGEKLQHAINNAIASQHRCLLVIHGRGKGSFDKKPAIKSHVNQWLRDCEHVLAFHSAQPRDGGLGALYVLIRRVREK